MTRTTINTAPDKNPAEMGVFFNSLPKSGKNLVYSFFSSLGLERLDIDEAFNADIHDAAYSAWPDQVVFSLDRPLGHPGAAAELAHNGLEALAGLNAGQIAQKHLPFLAPVADSMDKAERRSIFLWRDPRDVLVSMLNYARSQSKPEHLAARLVDFSDEDALIALLEGRGDMVPFADYVEGFLGWIDQPGVMTVCFEDLVGPEGGGTAERQRRTFEEICSHFKIHADSDDIVHAAGRAFNRKAGTFFKGRAGAWRDQFTPAVADSFEKHASALQARWDRWRLDRLERYAAGLDNRFTDTHASLQDTLKRFQSAEEQIEMVVTVIKTEPVRKNERLFKRVARRISAEEARCATAERRLADALEALEARRQDFKKLEREFQLRGKAIAALQARSHSVAAATEQAEQLEAIVQQLNLDPSNPLNAIRREIDQMRFDLVSANAALEKAQTDRAELAAGLKRRDDTIEAFRQRLEALKAKREAVVGQMKEAADSANTKRQELITLLQQKKAENRALAERLNSASERLHAMKQALVEARADSDDIGDTQTNAIDIADPHKTRQSKPAPHETRRKASSTEPSSP